MINIDKNLICIDTDWASNSIIKEVATRLITKKNKRK
jgi:hypothetical protein